MRKILQIWLQSCPKRGEVGQKYNEKVLCDVFAVGKKQCAMQGFFFYCIFGSLFFFFFCFAKCLWNKPFSSSSSSSLGPSFSYISMKDVCFIKIFAECDKPLKEGLSSNNFVWMNNKLLDTNYPHYYWLVPHCFIHIHYFCAFVNQGVHTPI